MKQSCFPINKQEILAAVQYYRSVYHLAIYFINYTLLDTIKNISREKVLAPVYDVRDLLSERKQMEKLSFALASIPLPCGKAEPWENPTMC